MDTIGAVTVGVVCELVKDDMSMTIVLVEGPVGRSDGVRVGLNIGVVSGVEDGNGRELVLVRVNFGILEVDIASCVETDKEVESILLVFDEDGANEAEASFVVESVVDAREDDDFVS